MRKVTAKAWAAVGAAGILAACSSGSNSSGNGNLFPFSGPSCPAGTQATMQPGMSSSSTCSQCVQGHCSNAAACVATDCADFFNCFCACAMGNINCLLGCTGKVTPACNTCNSSVSQCRSQNCSSECSSGMDAGAID